jgi:outer membrane receptor protein involved in Fe transport
LVHRAPATGSASDGSLWIGTAGYVTDSIANLGEQLARGVDLTAQYRLDMAKAGKLTIDLDFNYDIKFETTPIEGGGSYNCAGYYGATCGAPAPHMKSRMRFNWHTPLQPLDAWMNWRFIGPVKAENLSSNPLLTGYVYPADTNLGNSIPGYNYIDLGVSYQVAKQLTVRAGVNNVLDKDPPLVGLAYLPGVLGNGNTFPQVYDTLGRYIFLNLTADF